MWAGPSSPRVRGGCAKEAISEGCWGQQDRLSSPRARGPPCVPPVCHPCPGHGWLERGRDAATPSYHCPTFLLRKMPSMARPEWGGGRPLPLQPPPTPLPQFSFGTRFPITQSLWWGRPSYSMPSSSCSRGPRSTKEQGRLRDGHVTTSGPMGGGPVALQAKQPRGRGMFWSPVPFTTRGEAI